MIVLDYTGAISKLPSDEMLQRIKKSQSSIYCGK